MFTSAELLTIAEILDITPQSLNSQIVYQGELITADVEAAARSDFAEWTSLRGKFTVIVPNEKNFGASINPNERREAIRKRLSRWLGFDTQSRSTIRLHRV